MSYVDLYAAWRWEINEPTLGGLPEDFYVKIAAYLHRINEDTAIDKKSVKVSLLEHETRNVHRMLDELLKARYRKIIKSISKNQRIPTEVLATEEAKMCETFAFFSEAYQTFAKSIPAIMGADMKSYGPFGAEDVASLPAVNARMLVKQGLAVLVEVS